MVQTVASRTTRKFSTSCSICLRSTHISSSEIGRIWAHATVLRCMSRSQLSMSTSLAHSRQAYQLIPSVSVGYFCEMFGNPQKSQQDGW